MGLDEVEVVAVAVSAAAAASGHCSRWVGILWPDCS